MKLAAVLLASTALAPAMAFAQNQATDVDRLTVSASPLSAADIPQGQAPYQAEFIGRDDLIRTGPASLIRALGENSAQVQVNGAQANPFQPNIFYRGFEASPLVGNAQGLAVYVEGVRFNQAFGDTVNWDLIPDGAIRGVVVEGANPVYGLNALGGSIDVRLKTGADVEGFAGEASAGAFGRTDLFGEFGHEFAGGSVYVGARALDEDGWRDFSPSTLRQGYAGLQLGGDRLTSNIRLMIADNDLTGNGTSPIELLAVTREAVFTHPDNTRNRAQRLSFDTDYAVNDSLSLQALAYVQRFRQRTMNGDAAEIETCDDPFEDFVCLEDEEDEPLEDADGNFIADILGGDGYAVLNRGATDTDSYGLTLQFRRSGAMFGGRSRLIGGVSFDGGSSTFRASTELGEMGEDRGYEPNPGVIVESDEIGSIGVAAHNRYYGVYLSSIAELTPELTLTLSGRYNHADVTLRDLDPGGPLTGSHAFSRFNPAIGLTWQGDGIVLFGGYSEANRAPTPAELSCADPAAPCSLTNFFVGDPPLEQVVARTFEAGVRGRNGPWRWALTGFSTRTEDDIMFIASPIVGRAYFQNVGKTHRGGVQADLGWRGDRASVGFSYALTDATFESPLVLNAPENPFADANGQIHVSPGDEMPGVARSKAKLNADFNVTDRFTAGASVVHQGGQRLFGDEANQNPRTDAFTIVNLATRFRLNDRVELFASVENLFDTDYETFGTFSPVDEVELDELPGGTANDPRALSPGMPRAAYGGLKVRF